MERYRIHPEAAVYFLTYSIVEWLPIFVSQASCKFVTDSLAFCHREKHLRINAFVIMPTHLHLIVLDADLSTERLVRTLADFRKFTGRQLSDYCDRHGPRVLPLRCAIKPPRIGSAVCGSRAVIRKRSRENAFGDKSLIISMTIHAARAWCAILETGGFRPRPGICRRDESRLTCR